MQGIQDPISGGEIRDKFDKFKVRNESLPFYFLCQSLLIIKLVIKGQKTHLNYEDTLR